MINIKDITAFALGCLSVLGIFFIINNITKTNEENTRNDYYIITNQISKMNKMVVMEQSFSTLQSTKMNNTFLGKSVSEKKIITLTETNVQVSYDLSKMKIEVDSTNKKLIIKELPNADVKITPSVEIQSMDDSFFNRFNDDDIRKITQNAKNTALKNINQEQLKKESKTQLLENLKQIFVLAKALNYTIEDDTKQLDFSTLL